MPRLWSNFLAGHAQREDQSRVVQPRALIGDLRVSVPATSSDAKQTDLAVLTDVDCTEEHASLRSDPSAEAEINITLHNCSAATSGIPTMQISAFAAAPPCILRERRTCFYMSTRGAPLLTTTTGTKVDESAAHELNRIGPLIF
jgi:hypothetical protein